MYPLGLPPTTLYYDWWYFSGDISVSWKDTFNDRKWRIHLPCTESMSVSINVYREDTKGHKKVNDENPTRSLPCSN